MGAALVLLLVGLGALAAGVLIGRYYVPDDRQQRRAARHARAYMRALSHLIARDFDTAVGELRAVVEDNIEDVEPYFALGALFRSRGEHERAIRVHQALAVRERDQRKLRQRALYELGLDFRAAGMPRRATRAMEEVLLDEPDHEAALRVLAALYEEQARFGDAAELWGRLGRRRDADTGAREHHLRVAAAQAALASGDDETARRELKAAQRHAESAHWLAAAAELAAARGNHAASKQRTVEALIAEPGLAPHLLPGLVAAEHALLTGESPGGAASGPASVIDDLHDAPPLALTEASATSLPVEPAPAAASTSTSLATSITAAADGVALVASRPADSVASRVLATLADIERQTGPRLELALIRAELIPAGDDAARAAAASELVARFPGSLPARVAAGRLALVRGEPAAVRDALDGLVGAHGPLAWALRGRWQCAHCGQRPAEFGWRCAACRRWGTLRLETGDVPPPRPPRERRAQPRGPRAQTAPGIGADVGAPAPALPAPAFATSDDELVRVARRGSLLDRVGGWVSDRWRADR